jgi:outer membrane protein OmpA-like peptidoglycan-associated protein
MANSLPKASNGTTPAPEGTDVSKTPPGVWVIVGIALLFVFAGLGISGFVIWKAIRVETPVEVVRAVVATGKIARPVATPPRLSEGEVGVDHPSLNPTIDDPVPTPPVVSDRAEEDRTRQEVLQRIDLMKALTNAEKDKLYAQVERARGFTKIAIIPFTQNKTTAGAAQVDGLVKNLKGPAMQKLLADPTVALIVVGYADKKGDESKNLNISRSRAESVVQALKDKMDLVNLTHAVGMGGQDFFDPSDLEKNRVVEVWAVQP